MSAAAGEFEGKKNQFASRIQAVKQHSKLHVYGCCCCVMNTQARNSVVAKCKNSIKDLVTRPTDRPLVNGREKPETSGKYSELVGCRLGQKKRMRVKSSFHHPNVV